MKYLILFLSISVFGAEHPIYNQIIKNKPTINKHYAMKLSNIIHRICVNYKIPKNIYTAILMQESRYNLNTIRTEKGLYKGKVVAVETDFGIGQIHYSNLELYNFDRIRLITNLNYSVKAGAIILSQFQKRYNSKEYYWWARYNCGNRSNLERETCQTYIKKVSKYL